MATHICYPRVFNHFAPHECIRGSEVDQTSLPGEDNVKIFDNISPPRTQVCKTLFHTILKSTLGHDSSKGVFIQLTDRIYVYWLFSAFEKVEKNFCLPVSRTKVIVTIIQNLVAVIRFISFRLFLIIQPCRIENY